MELVRDVDSRQNHSAWITNNTCLKSGNVEVDKEDQDIGGKPHPRIKITLTMTACNFFESFSS